MVIVKSDINKMLEVLLGEDYLAIDLWWNSNNVALFGKSPNDVYMSGDEGREMLYNYVRSFYEGVGES